jgi:hypothetical protein
MNGFRTHNFNLVSLTERTDTRKHMHMDIFLQPMFIYTHN